MGLKKSIRRFIQKAFGTYEISENIRDIKIATLNTMKVEIIKNLNIPKEQKETMLLSLLPMPQGWVTQSYNSVNLKKYLSLVNPIELDSIFLKRVGGSNDGGYVMLMPESINRSTPPHF
ncbi:MAG: hypothetical protein K2P17_01715 [Helicobacteraceae bacterium]|nr:hypothetical protein [Helicobacteraceae bacterium]